MRSVPFCGTHLPTWPEIVGSSTASYSDAMPTAVNVSRELTEARSGAKAYEKGYVQGLPTRATDSLTSPIMC